MSEQAFDPVRYKREQRESWNEAAPGWEKWSQVFDSGARAVSDRLVALARIKPGDRVLDIATGTGEPAITAARAVGPSGHILALDHSAGMLEVARRRAGSLGVRNIEFREGDAESPGIGEHDVDAVLCRWGLMFLTDLDAAVKNIARVLKPGGWFATAVWASADKVPMISLGAAMARQIAQIAPPPPGTPDPFRLFDTSIVGGALECAGFRDMVVEPMIVTFEFESAEAFVECRREMSPAFRTLLLSKPPEIQRRIIDAILTEARPYVGGDGRMRTQNQAFLIAAHI